MGRQGYIDVIRTIVPKKASAAPTADHQLVRLGQTERGWVEGGDLRWALAPAPASQPTERTAEQSQAAAAKAYRDYAKAAEQVVITDPATFEPLYASTTGFLNDEVRYVLGQLKSMGAIRSGEETILSIRPGAVTQNPLTVQLGVCVNDQTRVVDPQGAPLSSGQGVLYRTVTVTQIGDELKVAYVDGGRFELSCQN